MNRFAQKCFGSLLLDQSLCNDSYHQVIIFIIARIKLRNFREKKSLIIKCSANFLLACYVNLPKDRPITRLTFVSYLKFLFLTKLQQPTHARFFHELFHGYFVDLYWNIWASLWK